MQSKGKCNMIHTSKGDKRLNTHKPQCEQFPQSEIFSSKKLKTKRNKTTTKPPERGQSPSNEERISQHTRNGKS